MADEKEVPQTDFEKFAGERSHRNSQISNEHSRATAQATILINGGAATAVLAFLAKDKLDPNILTQAPWSVAAYTFGVLFGAFMMFSITNAIDGWNMYWLNIFQRKTESEVNQAAGNAKSWWWFSNVFFCLSVLCFIAGSTGMAIILSHSTPPQDIRTTFSPGGRPPVPGIGEH